MTVDSVYAGPGPWQGGERPVWRQWASSLALCAGLMAASHGAVAQDSTPTDPLAGAVLAARDAFRAGQDATLQRARDELVAAQHPLAPWAEYWALMRRLPQATPAEVDAFIARAPDSFVADRMRNDWLQELGRRRDWPNFLRVAPTFRMDDDREVTCYTWWARFETGQALTGAPGWPQQPLQAWWAQRDPDGGCHGMARRFLAAGLFTPDHLWRKLRLAAENNRPRVMQQSGALLGERAPAVLDVVMDAPQRLLMAAAGPASNRLEQGGARTPGARMGPSPTPGQAARGRRAPLAPALPEVAPDWRGGVNLLAFIRWATTDPEAAAQAIDDPATRQRWQWRAEEAAWAWAHLGRHAAWRVMPAAPSYFERALADLALAASTGEWRPDAATASGGWSADTLQWMARSGLRAAVTGQPARWSLVEQAIDAMPPEMQQEDTWRYWKARALLGRAPAGAAGETTRQAARALMAEAINPLSFYGQLAHETLHRRPHPAITAPAALTEAERQWALSHPGVDRSLRLFALGLRSEAVREWNFNLRHSTPGGFNDRQLLAVADAACARAIWDRCINTSERTRSVIDLSQRYPTPFREDVLRAARDVGLPPSYMYGLIRQESRFIVAARSHVGASGLMQVMPATAAWTARKLGIPYSPEMINDLDTNLRIGAGYLKLVLDDFQGTEALAAAAYNAGPSRPRRWRQGPTMEAAAWVENVPFTETRDYVKKVLANAVVYAHVLHGHPLSINNRLGATIGPRLVDAPAEAGDLP